MAETFIYKPDTVNSWKRGPVILVPSEGPNVPPTITTADGKTYTGKYVNTNEGRHQYVFPAEIINQQDLKVSYNGQTSTIASGATSYEGSSLSGWQERQKGSLGAGGSGFPNEFQPGGFQYGVAPAYVGDKFPKPTFATFDKIKKAPFKYTDPFEFAGAYADLARDQIGKNIGMSKDIAMDQLDTELQGLQRFVPAASALKRSEISLDNLFNQQQRLSQVERTLPGAKASLEAQTGRAETYASGRLTDDLQDRALELGVRSRAADRAAAGGFGSRSSVSRKASDLMSAEERFKIAQYGENLLTGSIGTRADLLLAPTQYSDAGSQVRVTPTLSGSQLQQSALSELNRTSVLSPESAISNIVTQNQFITNNTARTREFNATNRFNESQFNANVANQFGLTKFEYEVGYAGAVAGAAQTNINTQVALDQQQAAQDTFEDNKDATQANNSVGGYVGAGLGAVSILTDWFGGGGLFDFGGDVSATGEAVTSGNEAPVSDYNYANPDVNYDPTVPDTSFARQSATSSTPPTRNTIGAPPTRNVPGAAPTTFTRQSATSTALPPSHAKQLESLKAAGVDVSSYVPPGELPQAMAQANVASQRVMSMSGIYNEPGAGRVRIGYDDAGKPLYASTRLANSANIQQGAQTAKLMESMIKPFNAMKPQDQKKFSFIQKMASDPQFLGQLQSFRANGDEEGFINALKNYALQLKPEAKAPYKKRVGAFVGAVEEGLSYE